MGIINSEATPDHWHSGVITSIYKKGDKQDMNNYRGITLLSVVGKLHNRILNHRLTEVFDVGNVIHEAQNGFRRDRSCPDHILTLSQILLGRKRQKLRTFCFFLDIKKAYDTVWRNGLWYRLWHVGIRGKAWRIIKNMYDNTRSCVSIDGQLGEFFDASNGVAQGDTLSPILFSLFINSILEEIQGQNLGVSIDGKWLGALMFADDFVGICESEEELQRMIDILHRYALKFRFQANVDKCAVVVFGDNDEVSTKWNWGNGEIPIKSSYVYLGVRFDRNCGWDVHATDTADAGMAYLEKLKSLLTNKHLSTEVKRTILLAVLKPMLTYAGEVWEPNAGPAAQLELVMLKACRYILQCGKRTSAEPMRGDLGFLPLKYDRVLQKLMF